MFKETHKTLDGLEHSGFSVAEIKKDITHMEDEKVQLSKRLQRLKQKLEGVDQYGPMLEAARLLRQEHEREEELERQQEDQTQQVRKETERTEVSRMEQGARKTDGCWSFLW